MPTLEEEIQYRGSILEPRIVLPNDNLDKIKTLIETTSFTQEVPQKRSLKEIRRESTQFLNKYYELHYVPLVIEKRFGPWNIEVNKNRNPFRIPIFQIRGEDDFYGMLRETISVGDEITIAYRNMELSKNITEISALSYTHEITHTQLNHMRGLIRNFHNIEVLSIFNETLHAFEKQDGERLLRIHDKRRLEDLKEILILLKSPKKENEEVLIEASTYCISTLQAYHMFIMYYYGDKETRSFILHQIQRVFDGEITLDEILEGQLCTTFQKSQDMQVLKKYLHR